MELKEFKTRLANAASKEDRISLLDSHAENLFEKGRYGEAGEFYQQALDLAKQPNVRAYFTGQIGICQYNAGNDKEAVHHLLKSARLFDPQKPEFMPDMCGFVHFYLGSLFEYYGKVTKSLEARQICEKYVEAQERDTQWMLYAGISRNCELLGRHDEAIKYSQKAIQVLSDNDPGLAYLYESMGNNYMGLKQYHEAIKYFSKVMELDPAFERSDDIHIKVASCYQQLTNDHMALETYEKMLELKQLTGRRENLIWLYIKIAQCQFRLERYEKSLLVTLEALRRRPRNKLEKAEVRSYLTNNYYELGRYKEAATEGEKTLKIAKRFPGDNLFYFRMALSQYKLGDKRSFAKYRSLCRKRFGGDSWIAYLDKLN
ncbi:MAG: tetratricopeptide repeat protein [Acidobacteriia bacterium]|nr:tetratricopeptide repeat protein [Terriglobia bacterium]